jgi:alpha-ketoglutarate-dependent taurine dioxygenase
MSTLASSGLSNLLIRPVAGRIGAEVGGLRLSGDLDQAIVDAIRQSLYRFKVLFFRGQEHLDELGQEAFGRLFGELVSHPTLPSHQGTQHVLDVDGAEIDQYLSLDGMLAHMSGGIGIDLGDVAWDEPIGDVQVERR